MIYGTNAQQILLRVQNALMQLRAAYNNIEDVYKFTSGITAADLTGLGFSATDASDILAAIADAHAEIVLHNSGLPPASYPQPPTAYVYSAAQNRVMGAQ